VIASPRFREAEPANTTALSKKTRPSKETGFAVGSGMVMPTATISSSLSGVSAVASTCMSLGRLISLPQPRQQFAIVHNCDRVIIATGDVVGDCALVRRQQVLDVQYTIRFCYQCC